MKSYSVHKRIGAPNTIDLRVKLDVLAKIHFIGHNSPDRSHLVWPIDLNKPKYCVRVPKGQNSLMCTIVPNTTNPLEYPPKT